MKLDAGLSHDYMTCEADSVSQLLK